MSALGLRLRHSLSDCLCCTRSRVLILWSWRNVTLVGSFIFRWICCEVLDSSTETLKLVMEPKLSFAKYFLSLGFFFLFKYVMLCKGFLFVCLFFHWKLLLKIKLLMSLFWGLRNFIFKSIRHSLAFAEVGGWSAVLNTNQTVCFHTSKLNTSLQKMFGLEVHILEEDLAVTQASS